jgi:phage-related protein
MSFLADGRSGNTEIDYQAEPIAIDSVAGVLPATGLLHLGGSTPWRFDQCPTLRNRAEVKAELERLPVDIQASFLRISRLIEAEGLERMREPYVKHLEGPLWEMRMKGKDGIARAAYVTATGRRVVVVRVFAKKTQKAPRRETELALKRAKEVT